MTIRRLRHAYRALCTLTAAAALAVTVTACSSTSDQAATTNQTTSTMGSSTNNTPVASAAQNKKPLDLQAHRGGRGEMTEESLPAFSAALDAGVTTLELDVAITSDGVPVVWHDPVIEKEKCSGPHVGKLIHDLTWTQIGEITCDRPLKDFPDAHQVKGNKIARLDDVVKMAESKDPSIRYNIETKLEPEDPTKTAPAEDFVKAILEVVDKYNIAERTTIQSFDWSSLPIVASRNPKISLALLYDATTWVPNSVWTGPVDYEEVDGDLVRAAQQIGGNILSGNWKMLNQQDVTRFQEAGLLVLPWTVNESADISHVIDLGIDGLITDYPHRALDILGDRSITVG